MQRDRIMEASVDVALCKKMAKCVALVMEDYIHMVNMIAIGRPGQGKWKTIEPRSVLTSDLSPSRCPLIQEAEFLGEDEGLDSFHPIIESDLVMAVPLALPVIA